MKLHIARLTGAAAWFTVMGVSSLIDHRWHDAALYAVVASLCLDVLTIELRRDRR